MLRPTNEEDGEKEGSFSVTESQKKCISYADAL